MATVVLYGVAPAILEVLGAYRRLRDVDPGWWIVVVATSAASTWCMCSLQRLALNRPPCFPVATSQLAGAAFSKVVPGGSAAAAALQARMLLQTGLPPAASSTGFHPCIYVPHEDGVICPFRRLGPDATLGIEGADGTAPQDASSRAGSSGPDPSGNCAPTSLASGGPGWIPALRPCRISDSYHQLLELHRGQAGDDRH